MFKVQVIERIYNCRNQYAFMKWTLQIETLSLGHRRKQHIAPPPPQCNDEQRLG